MPGASAFVRLRFERFELQLDERRLLADGQPTRLRGHAFKLLAVLAERPGHLITKTELLQRVWGQVVVEENALQAHISALRKVLGVSAIATVSGQGYRFTLDVQPVPAPQHNLPLPLTSFIGREREIEQVREHLPTSRLLTLTGAGGIGKTRLALQVARASLERYPGGVWLVELAPLGDTRLLVQAVARALGIEAKPGQVLDEVVLDWLRPRQALLVLDNAEHLLEACARLADGWLRRCAGLTVLATSRERLNVDGERTYRVPSLSVPAGGAGEDPLASEATRLLMDRARLLRPGFDVKADELATLASVCQRLDGIALAIELAAARLRMMSLGALNRRLDDRFRVLGHGPRTAMPRHQTLRSLIDWSHELLSGSEKAMLRRVSVFAGGWTVEAAERVCAGEDVDSEQVWALLSSLSDKSLVIVDTGSEQPRFAMLETLRQYAQDRLLEAGEQEMLHKRHLRWLIDMAGGLEATRQDAEVQRTLHQLKAEHDNLRIALAWCEGEPARALEGLRLAAQLNWYWLSRGHFVEGRSWLDRLLAQAPPGERGEAIAAALHTSGALAILDHDATAGAARLQQATVLWRELGKPQQLVRSIGTLANFHQNTGDYAAARAAFTEALSIAQALDNPRSVANALMGLSSVERAAGDPAAAEALLVQALPIARTVGLWVEGVVCQLLGTMIHARGDLEAAEDMFLNATEKLREFGDVDTAAFSHLLLAQVYQDKQDLAAARAHMQRALRHSPQGLINQLDWLAACAGLMSALAGPHSAARLWGCLQRHDEAKPSASLRWTLARRQRLEAASRRALGDSAAFDQAWQEGRAWSLDEAFEHTRGLL